MKSTLIIRDLELDKELDHEAMASVYGGGSKKSSSSSATPKSPPLEYLIFTLDAPIISTY